jgi:hypothetical protein
MVCYVRESEPAAEKFLKMREDTVNNDQHDSSLISVERLRVHQFRADQAK